SDGLLLRVQGVLRLFEKFILQLQRLLIGLDRLDGLYNLARPFPLIELAQRFVGRRSHARVMVGKLGVPPNAGVNGRRQFQMVLVGAGLAVGAIHVNQVWPRNQHGGGLGLAGVHAALGFQRRPSGNIFVGQTKNIDHVIARGGQLRLREKRQQAVVAAMTVDDQNLLASIAGHLFDRLLQKHELCGQAVGNGPGLLLRFEDLSEIVFRKNHRILLHDSVHHCKPHVDEVGPERKMRSMLLDDSERKQADTLGLMDSLHEIGGSEFFPLGRELALGYRGNHKCDENENKAYSGQTVSWHGASRIMKQAILSENTAIRAAGSELTPARCHRPADRAALWEVARECPDSPDCHSAELNWRQLPAPASLPAIPATASGSGTLFRSCAKPRSPLLPT